MVHTHLCILLAEGDDLELKRPKMFAAPALRSTPGAPSGGRASSSSVPPPGLQHSKSLGTMDLSQVSLEKDGTPRLRAPSGDSAGAAVAAANGGGADTALGSAPTENTAALEVTHGCCRFGFPRL